MTKVLNDLISIAEGTDELSKIRAALLGGGPAPLPLLQKAQLLNVPVYQTYGMTETCSQIATLSPEFMLSKTGSAGKALFGCSLEIRDNQQKCLPGVVGEIVVKGPNVSKGYYKIEHESDSTGYFYTGDLGYVDEDGFLFVVDRRSDLIISGGENIYPADNQFYCRILLLKKLVLQEKKILGAKCRLHLSLQNQIIHHLLLN